MSLAAEDVRLFFTVVRIFMDTRMLPRSGWREPAVAQPGGLGQHQFEDEIQIKRKNEITLLKYEMQQLTTGLASDRAASDLPDDDCNKTHGALKNLLDLLNGLVDDKILRNKMNPPRRFPKLQALEALLRPSGQIAGSDLLIHLPAEILGYIKYPADDAEPQQYREIRIAVRDFNQAMRDTYKARIVEAEPDLFQAESTEVFYRSREDTSDDGLLQAERLCGYTKTIAKAFEKSQRLCEPPHAARIHLSGFEESEIDMVVSMCGNTQQKWHDVQWLCPSPTSPPNAQKSHTIPVCSSLKRSQKRRHRLRIQLEADGSWNDISEPQDQTKKYVALEKTLKELLYPKEVEDATQEASRKWTVMSRLRLVLNLVRSLLCLLGSPLLQEPWESRNILVKDIADESSDRRVEIKPYVFIKLMGYAQEDEPERSQKARLSIIYLGVLLCELLCREKVTITDDDKEYDDENKNIDEGLTLYNALNRTMNDLKPDWPGDNFYLNLIFIYLKLYDEYDVIDNFRAKLYRYIFEPLKSFESHRLPKKETATATIAGRPVPPQQHATAITKSRPLSKYRNRLQNGTASIARPILAKKTAGQNFLGYDQNDPRNRGGSISFHLSHEPSEALASRPWAGSMTFNGYRVNHRRTISHVSPKNKECVLFDADSHAYPQRIHPDPNTEDFVSRMMGFIRDNIIPLPEEPQHRGIRIAVLDTGIHIDEEDELLKGAEDRIVMKQSFLGSDPDAYVDSYGHGTHVVRLLLRFAPRANILVAKISESKQLTGIKPIVKALKWVNDHSADIIVMTFGLGQDSDEELQPLIAALVKNKKLIFAAASNGGGNEPRAFPAKEFGVFCIHVSDGKGNKTGINPPAGYIDNFSTLGHAVESQWNRETTYISGSSFSTPIAAAIAANALEFIRQCLMDELGFFQSFQGMRALFRCLSDRMDGYDYVKSWKKYLWDDGRDAREVCAALKFIAMWGPEYWIKRTSEDTFSGFKD